MIAKHRELRCAVGNKTRIPLTGGDRRGVDDLATAALSDHLLGRFLRPDQHTEGVHVHHPVPDLFGDFEERLRLVEACVVEHHIELGRTVSTVAAIKSLVESRRLTSTWCAAAIESRLLELGGDRLGSVEIEITDHHARHPPGQAG